MAISDNNVRTQIILSKEFKKQLEEIAKEENRSLSNLIDTILKNYVNNRTQ